MRKLIEAVTPAPLTFEPVRTQFSIEVPIDQFGALIDTESYRTNYVADEPGNQRLDDALKSTVARDVEYNGHYGNQVALTIDAEDDTPEARAEITRVIQEHLAWCVSVTAK